VIKSRIKREGLLKWHIWGEERCIQGFGGENPWKGFGRPRHKCEDNIKMDLQQIGLV